MYFYTTDYIHRAYTHTNIKFKQIVNLWPLTDTILLFYAILRSIRWIVDHERFCWRARAHTKRVHASAQKT